MLSFLFCLQNVPCGAWHSVGLQTCVAVGFLWRLPVCVPPCQLFFSSTTVLLAWPAGNSCSLVFFLSSKEARFLWARLTTAAPGRDLDSHPVSGTSLIQQNEWQSPRKEGKWWLSWGSARTAKPHSVYSEAAGVPGPSILVCGPLLLRPSLPGCQRPAPGAGYLDTQAGPCAGCLCGKRKQSWVWGPWVSHLELLPGSPQTQVPAMHADDTGR